MRCQIVDMPALRVRSFFWQIWRTNWNSTTHRLVGGLQGSLSWFCINRWSGARPFRSANTLTSRGVWRPAGTGAGEHDRLCKRLFSLGCVSHTGIRCVPVIYPPWINDPPDALQDWGKIPGRERSFASGAHYM